jgi:hypothetical protein
LVLFYKKEQAALFEKSAQKLSIGNRSRRFRTAQEPCFRAAVMAR